ncbi:hypothetical protein GCM10011571_12980 [Marinithermofilum abyssi]|uniref:Uncharacterized protein n=1 Tax=Marinithermofilum abyssi TaxID=1571185 RepID=A0A8J2VI33_9BACL|nr:hypothetical protein [Marinithermofilum abyssi]GGE13011.1 hypothetical protein GCM10011571_12980 [Marinithermofilum abyssi]
MEQRSKRLPPEMEAKNLVQLTDEDESEITDSILEAYGPTPYDPEAVESEEEKQE